MFYTVVSSGRNSETCCPTNWCDLQLSVTVMPAEATTVTSRSKKARKASDADPTVVKAAVVDGLAGTATTAVV